MKRMALRIAIALAFVGLGWTIGKAQMPRPDFELIVDAPPGDTMIQCARGCKLMWVERGVNPNDTPQTTFSFGCRGVGLDRCSSARVGGWIRD
jgi:hypothetical protein